MNLYKNTIAIFGIPRSGTSWLGQIFNSSPRVAYRFQPLFSYEFKNRINENSSREDIEKFNRNLFNAGSDFVLQKTNISGKKSPQFTKNDINTLVWKEVRHLSIVENLLINSDTKVVFLVRHPCGVINSWINAPKEFDKNWDSLEEWKKASRKNRGKDENYYGYDRWKEAIKIFLDCKEKFEDRVFLLKYEDLATDPLDTTKQLFDFSGLNFEDQTRNFILKSIAKNDNDHYGVFRKDQDIDKWKQQLDQRIKEEMIADLANFSLAKKLGYS